MTSDPTMRVRFAPSPTGQLHVGNARTALFNWLLARGQGGTFILRIEDTDIGALDARIRARHPRGPALDGPRLERGGRRRRRARSVSPDRSGCTSIARTRWSCCRRGTRITASVRRSSSRPIARRRWPTAARRSTSAAAATSRATRRAGASRTARRRSSASACPRAPRRRLRRLVRGEVRFSTDVIGDPVLVRSDGMPAYNYAVVIDDALMEITHVIRGEDHISNTPRQLLLYEAFGWTPPAFAHVSLVMGPDHSPLSKRHGATSVAEFRARGYLPEALTNYLALIGWSPGDGRGAAAARRAGAALPARGRRPQRRRVRRREAGVGQPPLPEGRRRRSGWRGWRFRTCSRQAGCREPSAGGPRVPATASCPLAAASVDRLEQVPARLRFLFDYSAARALERSGDRAEARGGAAGDRRARRGARASRAADRPRRVPCAGGARARADGPEGQGAVPSDPAGADRRSRRARARSRRAGDRARRELARCRQGSAARSPSARARAATRLAREPGV